MDGIALFVEVDLGDPVVVDRQGLAEGVLRDLQPPSFTSHKSLEKAAQP